MSATLVPQATPVLTAHAAAAALPPKANGVAWNRLEGIDIATVEQAKVALKQQFPEAKVDQEKDYRIDVDHPILSDVFYSWDWGCTCLERVVFFFKDYPTHEDRGCVHSLSRARARAGPQDLTIDIAPSTTEASYRKALRILGSCRN
ncbi:MAG TPA: hypothetical protein VHW01_07325 [Polyangiaceae bacterium]|jgi:hypothetical protein|nr:hypothetical protein [Polyangiaceae bacterium]